MRLTGFGYTVVLQAINDKQIRVVQIVGGDHVIPESEIDKICPERVHKRQILRRCYHKDTGLVFAACPDCGGCLECFKCKVDGQCRICKCKHKK